MNSIVEPLADAAVMPPFPSGAPARHAANLRQSLDLRVLTAVGAALDKGPRCESLLRGLLRIRDKRGQLVPLVPNAAQAELERRWTRRNIVLKARQLGITTWVAARFFIRTITRPGTLSVQVAHDQHSAEEIFRIVHRFLENLPERLRQGALLTSRANVRQIVFPRLDSEYRVETAADPCAGRGLTIHHLHASEVARWPRDAAATLASLRAAVAPGGEVVLESTPNGAGGCFYDEWQRAPETGTTRHFLPWWLEPHYARPGVAVQPLTPEEQELVERHGLTHAQIAFRRDMRTSFRKFAAEEFAEDATTCFLASGECVFEIEIIEARLPQLAPAVELRDNGRVAIFWPPRREAAYIIGVDPAGGGTDGDFACAEVIDAATGLQCAELHGHFPPAELAARVVALAREYNDALVAVERNNHDHAVLAHLTAVAHYDRLYAQKNRLGWLTSLGNRPPLIERLVVLLNTGPGLFHSARLLEECRTFVRREDGSAAAANGAHDDCVMAMAIAQAVRSESTPTPPRPLELASLALRE